MVQRYAEAFFGKSRVHLSGGDPSSCVFNVRHAVQSLEPILLRLPHPFFLQEIKYGPVDRNNFGGNLEADKTHPPAFGASRFFPYIDALEFVFPINASQTIPQTIRNGLLVSKEGFSAMRA